jgi:sugar phosphate isomerase/epimerase
MQRNEAFLDDDGMSAHAEMLRPQDHLMVAINMAVDHEIACAQDFGLGAEVQALGLPDILSGDFSALLTQIKNATAGLVGPIGMHGPFIDLPHYSADVDIRSVCRKRYHQAFDIAEELGACYILFHSQYNPVIRVPKYRQMYHEGSLSFWPEFIERADTMGIPIYIENMFDDAPGPMCDVVHAIGSPALKLCLDVAHAAIFSKLSIADWVDAYGSDLAHIHINDCHGDTDDHLGLGMGSLDLAGAFEQFRAMDQPLRYVLETGEHTEASIKYLGVEKVVTT